MGVNRLLYLLALAACLVFYFASGVWFSWILLVAVAALPWLSLLLSLPAMLTARIQLEAPARVTQGEDVVLRLRVRATRLLPLAEVQARLNLTTADTDRDYRYLSRIGRGEGTLSLPTAHCGILVPRLERCRIYDYLGLFKLRRPAPQAQTVTILPRSIEPDPKPDLHRFAIQQLRPKAGGGFSEIHEHRPYRPGDPVKGIHWKLSLKSEDLIVREPMEPLEQRTVLAVQSPRTPAQRDDVLGRLRWISAWLTQRGHRHEILWMGPGGLCQALVTGEAEGESALVRLCACTLQEPNLVLEGIGAVDWAYLIEPEGGNAG